MAKHEVFNFATKEALQEKINELDIPIVLSSDTGVLARSVTVGKHTAPNAIAILPMEGCDSNADGSPSELVIRRYNRLAAGGAGLIWWEACAVTPDGRANPLQMMLTKENISAFSALLTQVNDSAAASMGSTHNPIHILQLTHSGRYSRPVGHTPAPIIPQHDPLLDARAGLSGDEPVVSDLYLDALIEHYVASAVLAQKAGFHGVDIKACHRYLLSELLACHTREGRYGGCFANRARLLLDIVKAVRAATEDNFIIACRFNIFDGHPYPYGFGVNQKDLWAFDQAEPLRLVTQLCASGVNLLSNSAGNPYYIYPQITRPFDQSSEGIPTPNEHPLESIARLFSFTSLVQRTAGSVPVVGNGYSWLRQFLPFAGAANIYEGSCAFLGLGRSAFAYPDAPKDILAGVGMKPAKCCIACSKCTQIMRDHGRTGCVVRDAAIYAPTYQRGKQ